MTSSTKYFTRVLTGLIVFAPLMTQAASLTNDQINSVVSLLQSFNVDSQTVQTVQSVLTHTPPVPGMMGSSTLSGWEHRPSMGMGTSTLRCLPPMRNLMRGSQGDDVKNLQQILASDPQSGFQGEATGYYGPMTAQAMMRFQENYHIASSTTGVVGPLTRQFLERRCGKVTEMNGSPEPMVASGTPKGPPAQIPPATQVDN